MQNINNNMDEMFRKAADGYPLKTDNSDWDGLASRLLIPTGATNAVQKKSNFNKYGLPLLMVLLMLVVGGGFLKQTSKRITAFPPSNEKSKSTIQKSTVILNLNATAGKQQQRSPGLNHIQTTHSAIDKISGKVVRTIDASELTYDTEQLVRASDIASAVSGLSLNKTITAAQVISEKKTNTIQRSSKFYWGIVIGPGINQVKKQRVQKPGFDIGIMAGISVLKGKAAVETGLLYTQKYYFSEGKYFNMDKAGGSMQGMEIMSLEGSSRLFELPLKFKYRVLQKNRAGVFLTTGISSYLMTTEENDYVAMMNGSEQSMIGMYKNTRRYLAVTANVGAEFNFKIGARTRLGIEPYYQIPLKGIGIGSMPVMTTGIHFSIMRSTP